MNVLFQRKSHQDNGHREWNYSTVTKELQITAEPLWKKKKEYGDDQSRGWS